jgi:hypothetical protein
MCIKAVAVDEATLQSQVAGSPKTHGMQQAKAVRLPLTLLLSLSRRATLVQCSSSSQCKRQHWATRGGIVCQLSINRFGMWCDSTEESERRMHSRSSETDTNAPGQALHSVMHTNAAVASRALQCLRVACYGVQVPLARRSVCEWRAMEYRCLPQRL